MTVIQGKSREKLSSVADSCHVSVKNGGAETEELSGVLPVLITVHRALGKLGVLIMGQGPSFPPSQPCLGGSSTWSGRSGAAEQVSCAS